MSTTETWSAKPVLQETAAQAIGLLANVPFGKQLPAQRTCKAKPGLVQRSGSGGSCASNSLKGKMPAHSCLGGTLWNTSEGCIGTDKPRPAKTTAFGKRRLVQRIPTQSTSQSLSAQAGFQRCKVPNLHGSVYGSRPMKRPKLSFGSFSAPPILRERPGGKPPQDGAPNPTKEKWKATADHQTIWKTVWLQSLCCNA